MLKMISNQDEDPPSSNLPSVPVGNNDLQTVITNGSSNEQRGVLSFFKGLIKGKQDSSLRETLEVYIGENSGEDLYPSVSAHEKEIIANVLDLHDITAADVMVPRADIVGISHETTQEELFALLAERQYSRLPIYKETLDNVIGAIHVKDILATLAKGEKLKIHDLVRDVPIVSPAINLLDLLLQMRMTRKHMVLVIDEFGGIDGLVTIGDVIEVIVGKFDDEHDPDYYPSITECPDGTLIADARFDLEEFEGRFGDLFSEDEHEDNDTLGGLVFSLAGRVPVRGEIIKHENGMVFEVVDADPRRVKLLKIRNIPDSATSENLSG